MANISKFKDKKTGEVYDLGTKVWEITLTEEEFIEFFTDGELDVSQKEGISRFSDEYKYGDKLVVRALTGMGDFTFDLGTEYMGDSHSVAFETITFVESMIGIIVFIAYGDDYSLKLMSLQ